MTFQPHGLIVNPVLEALYQRVFITKDEDPLEDLACSLLINILRVIFGPEWAISAELRAIRTSGLTPDSCVEYLEQGTLLMAVLCFNEVKRSKKTSQGRVEALETQAFEYCRQYLNKYPDRPFVYATTMVGHRIRLWRCNQKNGYDDGWVPFWGSTTTGNISEYKDLGSDTDNVKIYFEQMKQAPPTPAYGQTTGLYSSAQPTQSLPGTGSTLYPAPSGHQYQTQNFAPSSGDIQYQSVPTQYYELPTVGQFSETTQPLTLSGQHYQVQTDPQSSEAMQYPSASSQPLARSDDIEEEEEMEYTQEAAIPKYHWVKVTKVPHLTRKDEFTFKDSRGRLRSTALDDWRRISYEGRNVWKHSKYVCKDNIFS